MAAKKAAAHPPAFANLPIVDQNKRPASNFLLTTARILDLYRQWRRARADNQVPSETNIAQELHAYAFSEPDKPLYTAIKRGKVNAVRAMVEIGVDPNSCLRIEGPDPDTYYLVRILRLCALENQLEVAKVLIELGANPSLSDPGSPALTPLETAAQFADGEFVKYLFAHGAELTSTAVYSIIFHCDLDVYENIRDSMGPVKVLFTDGSTYLHAAAVNRKTPEILADLLRQLGNRNQKAGDNNNDDAFLEFLNSRRLCEEVEGNGYTALMDAIGQNNVAHAAMLLFAGADPSLQCRVIEDEEDEEQYTDTALHLALQMTPKMRPVLASILRHPKCPVEVEGYELQTPLHLAARYPIKKEPNDPREWWDTGPLKTILQLTCMAMGFIDRQDVYNNSALHFAARVGNQKAVRLLLRAGADTTLRDMEEHTPEDAARASDHTGLADYIANWTPENDDGNDPSDDECPPDLEGPPSDDDKGDPSFTLAVTENNTDVEMTDADSPYPSIQEGRVMEVQG